MGSATWFVSHQGEKWVAKAVTPDMASHFAAGLRPAQHLDRADIPAGAPVATTDGQPTVPAGPAPLALLTWVRATR